MKFASESPHLIQEKLEKLTGDAKQDLQTFQISDEKSVSDFYQKVKSVVFLNQVSIYLKYLLLIYVAFYAISYGTIYA